MSEHQVLLWGDIATLEYGKGLKNYGSGDGPYPVYGTNGPIGRTSEPLSDDPTVVVGRKGAYRGIHYSPTPCFVIDTAFYLKPKIDFDMRWAYYSLLTYNINAMDSGSAIPSTSRNDFYALPVRLPPLEEQRTIAHILGTLDDKIELNRQMNRTLDEIARTLFTSWFVNFDPVHAKAEGRQPKGMDAETAALFPERFVDSDLGPIPEGWEVKTLGGIAANIRDNVPARELNPEDNYVGLEHLPKRHIGLSEWSTAEEISSNKSRFVVGDILFGKLRPYFHKVVVAPISGVSSTDILIIRPKECRHAALTLCAASSDHIIALADSHSSGTRMPRAKWSDLSSFPITLPTNEAIIDAFSTAIDPMIRMINHNVHESRTLAEVRDTLLPEMLSDRIRVPKAEIA